MVHSLIVECILVYLISNECLEHSIPLFQRDSLTNFVIAEVVEEETHGVDVMDEAASGREV